MTFAQAFWHMHYIDLTYGPDDTGTGGGAPPLEGGSSVTIKDTRTAFLNSVLGEHAKNISDRIGDENSDCWKYLQGLISQLKLDNPKSPVDLVHSLANASANGKIDVMGDVNGTATNGTAPFGPNGSTWAETTTSWPLGTGPVNEIVLGWKFFNSNQMNPSSVLIHEAFHLSAGGVLFLGFNVNGLSDSTLFAAAGVTSGEAFNKKIDDNCK